MLTNRRVLIVEDEPLIALDLETAVMSQHAAVEGPCRDLASALDRAQNAEIDAALLDVNLGGDTVFDAADALRHRGVPFVFHTGGPEAAEAHARYPDAPVCVKPCRNSELIRQLANIIKPKRH